MRVDFTTINKAYPKHNYLLPKISKLMDAIAGHALLSFMDAYSATARCRSTRAFRKRLSSSMIEACIPTGNVI